MASRAQKRAAERKRLQELYEKASASRSRKTEKHWAARRAALSYLRERVWAREAEDNGTTWRRSERYVWSDHEVDQGYWHGTRLATRGNCATKPHMGIAHDLRDWLPIWFLAGHALYVQSEAGDWKVIGPWGQLLGYAPPAMAMGWKIAAERKGIEVAVYAA